MKLPFFYHYENVRSCSFHKQLLTQHGKICPSFINLENYEEVNFTTQNILTIKPYSFLDFHSEYYIPEIEELIFHLPNF